MDFKQLKRKNKGKSVSTAPRALIEYIAVKQYKSLDFSLFVVIKFVAINLKLLWLNR
jgi:hypothetical protein